MRLFQKQSAEPDGSAEGKSFKLSSLGPGRFIPSHFSTFSYGSSMTPIDSICCPDYRQYAWSMWAQPFVICETQREEDARSPPKERPASQWRGQTWPPRAIIQVFVLGVFGGEQKAVHRKLDNQFCDFEISRIFHLALPLRSKKSSWYADLFRRSVFLAYTSPPSAPVLPWQVTPLDQWRALTFWQLTPLDVQGPYVHRTEGVSVTFLALNHQRNMRRNRSESQKHAAWLVCVIFTVSGPQTAVDLNLCVPDRLLPSCRFRLRRLYLSPQGQFVYSFPVNTAYMPCHSHNI